MRLLLPWWGSKVGWQLFLKPDWARSIQGRLFFPSSFPLPCLQTTVFFPATIPSVRLISSEAGNQIRLNYKVIKGHLKSCLSKQAPAQGRGCAQNNGGFSCKKFTHKKDKEDLFNRWWWCRCPFVKLNENWRQESLPLYSKRITILYTLWLYKKHGRKQTMRNSPRVHSFPQLLDPIQTRFVNSLRTLSPPKKEVLSARVLEEQLNSSWDECDMHCWSFPIRNLLILIITCRMFDFSRSLKLFPLLAKMQENEASDSELCFSGSLRSLL